MTKAIDYQELVASYEDGLLNRLRSHSVDHDFLEAWVPDQDVVKSLLNMVEAAEIAGHAAFAVRVPAPSLGEAGLAALAAALGGLATMQVEADNGTVLLRFSAIGG
jgi:hypothetical protein